MSFCGATDIPVLNFWWCLLWVSKPEWSAPFELGRGMCDVCYLRFTSGVTPANLLMANMLAGCFAHMHISAEVGCQIQLGDVLTTRPPQSAFVIVTLNE